MPTSRTTAPTRTIAAFAVACALAVSACGGDDEPTASTSTGAGASTTATTGGDTTASGGTGTTGGTSTGGGTTSSGGSAGGAAGGGSSSAGAGDEAAYVKTLESVCKRVAQESQTFVADVTKAGAGGGDPDDAFKKVKGPMTRFFDAIDARYQELSRAQAPAKWAAYQDSLRSDAAGVSKYLDQAKDLLNDADSPEDLSKLQELMGRTTFNTGDAPKDLAARTPSCSPAGGAAGGATTVTRPTQ